MFSKRRSPNVCTNACLSLMLLSMPVAAGAQDSVTSPLSGSPIADAAVTAASTQTMAEVRHGDVGLGPTRGVLVPLYISFATLQALDAHTTIHALNHGAREMNPMMQGIASRPAALIAVKGGVAASTILIADKLRTRSRIGAVVFMAAVNSLYATVVANNYSTIASLQ